MSGALTVHYQSLMIKSHKIENAIIFKMKENKL